jgi:hypothetical protein
MGWLTGEEGDFLQYECSELLGEKKRCDFTQVTLRQKQDPETVESLIRERLPSAIKDYHESGIGEICINVKETAPLLELLVSGDKDGARSLFNKMPKEVRENFDFADAIDRMSRLGFRELKDMWTMFGTIASICDEPSDDNVEALLRLSLEKEARTCKISINKWSQTFRPISEIIWALSSDGPEGICGVQRLDRFECHDGGTFCEFISEKRILNPDGKHLGISCGILEERAFRYKYGDGVYLDCNIVSFF